MNDQIKLNKISELLQIAETENQLLKETLTGLATNNLSVKRDGEISDTLTGLETRKKALLHEIGIAA